MVRPGRPAHRHAGMFAHLAGVSHAPAIALCAGASGGLSPGAYTTIVVYSSRATSQRVVYRHGLSIILGGLTQVILGPFIALSLTILGSRTCGRFETESRRTAMIFPFPASTAMGTVMSDSFVFLAECTEWLATHPTHALTVRARKHSQQPIRTCLDEDLLQ